MAVTETVPVVLCVNCGKPKRYVDVRDNDTIKLMCSSCEDPDYKNFIILKEKSNG